MMEISVQANAELNPDRDEVVEGINQLIQSEFSDLFDDLALQYCG